MPPNVVTLRCAHPRPLRGLPLFAIWVGCIVVSWGIAYALARGVIWLVHVLP